MNDAMDFDQRSAYNEGRSDANWLLVERPEEAKQVIQRMQKPNESEIIISGKEMATAAEWGLAVKMMLKAFRKITELEPDVTLPPELDEWLKVLDEVLRTGDGDKAEQISKECLDAELAKGVPLDDALPLQAVPEDEYWLLGFQARLKESSP